MSGRLRDATHIADSARLTLMPTLGMVRAEQPILDVVYARAVGRLGCAGLGLETVGRICLQVFVVTASRSAGGFRKRRHRARHQARRSARAGSPEPDAVRGFRCDQTSAVRAV
jgi:hypothetical protein